MSFLPIAKKELRDARRSKMLWLTIAAPLLFVILLASLVNPPEASGAAGMNAFLDLISQLINFLLPLPVLVIGYLSITSERESGSIKYLLGLPSTRLDVLTGKFVGRVLVAIMSVFVALLAGALIVWARFGTVLVGEYLGFILLTLFYTVTYIGIAVSISAVSSTRGRAMAGVLGVYIVFTMFWLIFNASSWVAYIVETLLGLAPIPELYNFIYRLSPSASYEAAIQGLVRGQNVLNPEVYGGTIPFYLQDWFTLVILSTWLVVPLVISYLWFRNAEI